MTPSSARLTRVAPAARYYYIAPAVKSLSAQMGTVSSGSRRGSAGYR